MRPTLMEKKTIQLLESACKDDLEMSKEDLQERSYFKSFTRMPVELFDDLYNRIRIRIAKKNTNWRKAVPPLDR